MANRSYTQATLKKLFGLSGNQCACPDCSENMITEKKDVLGEICHIHGLEEKAPRYDSQLDKNEINDYENLIVLCPNHHTKADKDPETYSSDKLKIMKETHEKEFVSNQYPIDDKTLGLLLNHFNQNQSNVNVGSGTQLNTQSGDVSNIQITNIFDLEQLGEAIFEKNFPKIKYEVSQIAKKSAMDFVSEIIKQSRKKLTQNDLSNFSDPDLQYVLTQSVISSGRNNDPVFHKQLASLFIDRIKNAQSNLKKIIYNEAIETLPKLTQNQLKIITGCFLLRNARFGVIKDVETFVQIYQPIFENFLNFHESNAEMQHTVYAGLASISIGSWDFKKCLKDYEGLEIEKALQTPTGKGITQFLEKSSIRNMTPTDVGIVIAIMYYENITNQNVDVDIFIN